MATSMAALSRRFSRALLSKNPKPTNSFAFCSKSTFDGDSISSELEDQDAFLSDVEIEPESEPGTPKSKPDSSSPSGPNQQERTYREPVLENGVDVGIFKAILVGRVGQKPIQKTLRSGQTLTMFSLGTGGMRNNRRPLENETPRDFADRSNIQWHRVCVYPERLGTLVMECATPGSILFVDGNLETKIFSDPITGIARRVREIAVRRNGRVVFLGKSEITEEPTQAELRNITY